MNHVIVLMHLFMVMLLISRYHRLQWKGLDKWQSVILFTLKFLLLYFIFGYAADHPQPGDVKGYLQDAQLIFEMFRSEPIATINFIFFGCEIPVGYSHAHFALWDETLHLPFFNDTHTVVLFNVLIRFVSMGASGVNLIWFCFIGWMGICMMTHALFHGKQGNIMWYLPFLVPQVFIWSGLVLKEPLLILALGCLINGLVQYRRSASGAFKFILFAFVLFLLVKTFVLVLLLPAIIAYFISLNWKKIPALPVYIIVCLLFFFFVYLVSLSYPSFDLPQLIYGQQLNMYRFVIYNRANTILDPIMLAPSWWSLIKRIPESIFYTLLQPLPWKYSFSLAWPLFIENIAVLVLLAYGIWRQGIKMLSDSVRLFLLFGGLTLLALAGFVGPIAGTLVRFKVPGLILLLLAFVPFTHHHHSASSKRSDDYLSNA